jgi:hypothetical protein
VLGKFVNNINLLLGNQVSQAELITQEMFHNFQIFALDQAKDTYSRFLPNYFYTLNDVSSMIVRKINDHMYTSSDKATVTYVIANQISSLIYEVFPNDLSYMVDELTEFSGLDHLWNIGKSLFNLYSKEQYEIYIQISESAMKSLSTERDNIQNRINRGFLTTNDVVKTTYQTLVSSAKNLLFSKIREDIPTNILKNVAQNLSNDFLRLQLEIEKIELALILLHLQNDILSTNVNESDTSPKTPSETALNIMLHGDDTFLSTYHSNKHVYLQKILLKNWLIMGLLKLERDGYTNNWELPKFTPMKGGNNKKSIKETDDDVLDAQLIDSFISNAKAHNRTALGNINNIKDINDKLKNKLIKSFVKHSQKNKRTIEKIKKFERRYNNTNSLRDDDTFLGM